MEVNMQYDRLFTIKRLWVIFITTMVIMISALLYLGNEIYQQAPPIPASVETTSGTQLFTADDINSGQNVW